MVSHRRRRFLESDVAALLSAIGACRDACIEALRRAPPTDEIARRTRALNEAIDDVVEVLTGNRQHFWLKPHGGPKLSKPDEP
jgi:hypothetical protein